MISEVFYSTKNRKYPYLGVSVTGEGALIVLFSSNNTGTVVGVIGSRPNKIGSYSESWVESLFTPFGGEIKLKNDD